MNEPFDYPTAPHLRKHGPVGYADYASFRPWLRDEFAFQCVYCLIRETWGSVTGMFDLDHLRPATHRPSLVTEYENLLLACAAKTARLLMGFPDDLPDLSGLKPPGGNTRPDGVQQSHFARKQRGELPVTY